jgi:hypothetical protein
METSRTGRTAEEVVNDLGVCTPIETYVQKDVDNTNNINLLNEITLAAPLLSLDSFCSSISASIFNNFSSSSRHVCTISSEIQPVI